MNRQTFDKWKGHGLPVIVSGMDDTPYPVKYYSGAMLSVLVPGGSYHRVHYRDCTFVRNGEAIKDEAFLDVTGRPVELGNTVLFHLNTRGWLAGKVTRISLSSVTVSVNGENITAKLNSLIVVPLSEEDIVMMKLLQGSDDEE